MRGSILFIFTREKTKKLSNKIRERESTQHFFGTGWAGKLYFCILFLYFCKQVANLEWAATQLFDAWNDAATSIAIRTELQENPSKWSRTAQISPVKVQTPPETFPFSYARLAYYRTTLWQSRPNMMACGFFELGLANFGSMLLTVGSYLAILTQFQQSEMPIFLDRLATNMMNGTSNSTNQ